FLTTAIVATQLLARARAEAVEARARATEVTSLSRLASETLNAGRAEEALVRIVDVIQGTLGVGACAIWPWSPERGFGERITSGGIETHRLDPDPLVQRAAERGEPLTLSVDGAMGSHETAPGARELFLPLGVQTLVADLLDLSRMKGDAFRAAPDINTAEDLIGAAQRQAQGLLVGGRSIRTLIDLESPALVGRFDFTHALRILGNLLENALRYTTPGESVELGVHRDDDALVFTVADRGPRIASVDAQRICQPSYRHADTSPAVARARLVLPLA